MADKLRMTVTMNVTVPQALALQAMFEYWNKCGSSGMSRHVAFMVDGDGNFQPKAICAFDRLIPELTKELADKAVVMDKNGDRHYDFDPVAWALRELRDSAREDE